MIKAYLLKTPGVTRAFFVPALILMSPFEFCEGVPLHYVIARGLDELEGHRKRSRRATSDSPAA